jgi:hypothetical protein
LAALKLQVKCLAHDHLRISEIFSHLHTAFPAIGATFGRAISACQVLRIACPEGGFRLIGQSNSHLVGHLAARKFLMNQRNPTMRKTETKAMKPLAKTDK